MHRNYFSTSDPFLPKPSQPCSGNYTPKKTKTKKHHRSQSYLIPKSNSQISTSTTKPKQKKQRSTQPQIQTNPIQKKQKKTHTTHNGDHDSDALPVQPNNPQNRDLISLNTPDPLPN